MSNKDIYESEILASIHETASDLYSANLLDRATMKEYDRMCLTSITSLNPEEIKAIRLQGNLSQEIFAQYLNVSPRLICKWETGETKPRGLSLKLLNIVKDKGISILTE